MANILIVDDDVAGCRTLQLHLSSQGHETDIAHSVDQGLEVAQEKQPELIILDIRMPGRSGLEGITDFNNILPDVRIIMITAFHDMETTIQAMQGGAEDYIHKPIDIDELDAAIAKLTKRNHSESEFFSTEKNIAGQLNMIGHSRAMKEVFKTIGLVAKNNATVLITGESGTGKELVARAIHHCGKNPDGPFVAINCAAMVENLLESEMFGHEKGAFTGAVNKQMGRFSQAENGTIFLDEIGEMSASIQAKLLRVIQYKEFSPIGAKQVKTSNARIVAATNVDLMSKVSEGSFREDLFYRLQVVNINLPPLRERKEDIVGLIKALLGKVNHELNREVTHVSHEVIQYFENYNWPGNVRELENLLMKAVALCPGDTITKELVTNDIHLSTDELAITKTISEQGDETLFSLEQMERKHVLKVLNAVQWHKGKACKILEVSRPRLRRIIQHHDLQPPTGIDSD